MIRLYKDLYIKYFVFSISGALLIIFGGNALLPNTSIMGLVIPALTYIICCVLFFISKATKRYNNMLQIIQKDCQCQRFIDEYNKTFEKGGRLKKSIKGFFDVSVTTAYLNLGQLENFKKAAAEVDTDSLRNKDTKTNAKFAMLNNWAGYYLTLEDKDEAERCIAQMKKMIDEVGSKFTSHDKMIRAVDFLKARLHILNKEYVKAEENCLYSAEYGSSTRTRVCANYFLGEIYKNTNNIEEAKSCYEYAFEKGGDTCYAQMAKEELDKL